MENLKKIEEEREKEVKQAMRQIIIETDGSSINIVKAEVSWSIELRGILIGILESIKK